MKENILEAERLARSIQALSTIVKAEISNVNKMEQQKKDMELIIELCDDLRCVLSKINK